jgi:transposase
MTGAATGGTMGRQQGARVQMSTRYNKQFKHEALKLVTEQGYKPAEAARKLGVPDTTYETWLKKAGWRQPQAARPSEDPAVLQVQLRQANARLKELELENEILKKATGRGLALSSAYFARQNL